MAADATVGMVRTTRSFFKATRSTARPALWLLQSEGSLMARASTTLRGTLLQSLAFMARLSDEKVVRIGWR